MKQKRLQKPGKDTPISITLCCTGYIFVVGATKQCCRGNKVLLSGQQNFSGMKTEHVRYGIGAISAAGIMFCLVLLWQELSKASTEPMAKEYTYNPMRGKGNRSSKWMLSVSF